MLQLVFAPFADEPFFIHVPTFLKKFGGGDDIRWWLYMNGEWSVRWHGSHMKGKE